ncbi:MAG: sodium-dependent transporter [Caldimicrobium sp.]|nr:sodium-dependent transporter [Caldimicrobium sp.]MCX7873985.1 sodium-dependent transporter [Caldimicrobium sp.]MDW8094133.1 sodium-dependent transporter [Caldimicrobium sp.]
MTKSRETWGTKVGLILASAGNAVGLGNLLRFPSKAALYGGGAFMVPYFISLLLLGLPVMLIEWVIGRYAGRFGHGSMTGIMGLFFKQASWARALGSLGVAIPILIVMYYLYVESWTLGFAILSLLGRLPEPQPSLDPKMAMAPYVNFFKEYTKPSFLAGVFFWITLIINWVILQRGVVRGIELTAKIGMPLLIAMGLFLGIISLATNNWAGLEGLKFIYNLNLSGIKDPMVWIEASGQIFFTLSLGMGAIATYASYVKPREDVVKAGLWTAGVNEFVEVIIGASIAIPAAFAMFGALAIPELAKEGTFRLGFMTMPAILMNLPLGQILSFIWFMLLFVAALTSSLALIQPMIALFEDEMKWSHTKAVAVSMLMVIIGAHCCAFLPHFLDEFDFWAGAVFLLLLAFIEIIVFVWVFGIDNFYQELTRDTAIKLPKIFVYIIGILSPLFIIFIAYFWFSEKILEVLTEKDPFKWLARLFILGVVIFLCIIAIISRKRVLEGPRI